MYMTFVTLIAFFAVSILACKPDTPGCDHPGNFVGNLTLFRDPATAHCSPGNESSFFANIPASFYNPPDESPCDSPINVTNPSTKKTISATVIGKCQACKNDSIQLTAAGILALAPSGRLNGVPKTVNWTFT